MLKEKCPNALISIFTNTTLLTLDIFIQVIPNLDKIVLDNYYKGKPMWNKNVTDIYEYIKDKPEIRDKVIFEMRNQEEILSARGGNAPNKKDIDYDVPEVCCARLYYDLVIRPSGELSLCCNDAQAEMTLGDVRNTSLVEAWYSNEFNEIRRKMMTNGRAGIPLCSKCDVIYEGSQYDCSFDKLNDNYVWKYNRSMIRTVDKQNTIDSFEEYCS